MQAISLFFSLSLQVLEVLVCLAPVTLFFAAVWVCAFAYTKPDANGDRWRIWAFGCLPQLAFPLAIIYLGAIFAVEPTAERGPVPELPGNLMGGAFLVQFPMAVVSCGMWGERWPAVAASWLMGAYVSVAALFISGMSASGNWL